MTSTRQVAGAAALLTMALLTAACEDSSDKGAPSGKQDSVIRPGMVNAPTDKPAPTAGGTLEYSLYVQPATLDPLRETATGASGGTVLAAVYDTLIRYDDESGEYEPQLAESIDSDSGFRTWTLKLRPGVKFGDGTSLDAESVVFNIKRIAESTSISATFAKWIERYETPDDRTVVFHLSRPWAQFPFLLSTTAGMIASPEAIREDGKQFWRGPAGAGPYRVSSFKPNEEIVLVKNPDYPGGKVHLDKIRFTRIAGDQGTADRYRSKDIQMGMVVDPEVITGLVKEGTPGHMTAKPGTGYAVNSNKGRVTADPRVRRAIAYAVNLDQLNARAAGNLGKYSSALFPDTSRWHTGTEGLKHDPAKARKLIEEVKKETGWDGSLRIVSVRETTDRWREALTLEAQLKAVGFKPELKDAVDTNGKIQLVWIKKDYDIADWSIPAWEEMPAFNLYANLASDGSSNAYGYKSKEMDRLLGELLVAPSVEEGKKTARKLQELWNRDQPLILTQMEAYYTFWDKRVRGVQPTTMGNMLLDEAFLKR